MNVPAIITEDTYVAALSLVINDAFIPNVKAMDDASIFIILRDMPIEEDVYVMVGIDVGWSYLDAWKHCILSHMLIMLKILLLQCHILHRLLMMRMFMLLS